MTLVVFTFAIFLLGFVADPIINIWLDPYNTIAAIPSYGQDAFGEIHILSDEGEVSGWIEHFLKGIASLGLFGFVKMFIALGPLNWYQVRTQIGGGRAGTTGRDRISSYAWIAVMFGVITFILVNDVHVILQWSRLTGLQTIWKGVRALSRRVLEKAGDQVVVSKVISA